MLRLLPLAAVLLLLPGNAAATAAPKVRMYEKVRRGGSLRRREAPTETLHCSGQRPEPALAALCRRRPVRGGGGATADDSQGWAGLGLG